MNNYFYLEKKNTADVILHMCLTEKATSTTYPNVEFSIDLSTWYSLAIYDVNDNNKVSGDYSTSLKQNEKVYFRCTTDFLGLRFVAKYSTDPQIYAGGNLSSLLDGTGDAVDVTKPYCFYKLFYGIPIDSWIYDASELILPYGNLADNAFESMFAKQTRLRTAPVIHNKSFGNGCYVNMFNGCSNLNNITCLNTEYNAEKYNNWVKGVSSTGTFTKSENMSGFPSGDSGIPVGWNVENVAPTYEGLTFTAIEPSTISLTNSGGNEPNIWYSRDLKVWTQWDYSTIELTKDSKIYFKGNNGKTFSNTYSKYSKFVMTGKIAASGNIMSLLDNGACTSKEAGAYCFINLFNNCKSLTTAPELPATTLSDRCYEKMFYGTSITTAPTLPATTLSNGCYNSMFYKCTSLVNAPTLPSTTLKNRCYFNMFYGCTSLVKAPEIKATTLADECCYMMFYGCTSLNTAPELKATTLAPSCYNGMFYNCTSLTKAPELPAIELANNCYNNMFYNCSKLNYIKALFTTTPGSGYTTNWVGGVATNGTFLKNRDATWNVTGDDGIPTGWSVETYPPTINYTLTLQGDNCTLNGGGTYNEGTTVEISCVPNTGYYFVRWSDGNTNATRTITVTENITLTAITAQVSSNLLEIKARKGSGEYERTNIIWYLDYKVNTFNWDARVYTDFDNLDTNFEISDARVTNNSRGNSWIGDSRIYSFDMTVPANTSDTNKEFTITITSTNGILSDTITIRVIQKPKLPVLIEDIFVSSGDVENALVTIPDNMEEVLVVYEGDTLFKYTIDDCVSNYVLYYRNALGGIDLFPVTGKVIKSNDIEHLTINKKYDNRTLNFGKTNYENVLTERWQLYSGRLTDQQSKLMHHLINSTYVYLYDIQADKFIPVVITDTEMEYKTYKNNNNKMVYYTINVEASQTKYRR